VGYSEGVTSLTVTIFCNEDTNQTTTVIPTPSVGDIFNIRMQLASGVQKIFIDDVEVMGASYVIDTTNLTPFVNLDTAGAYNWSLLDVHVTGEVPT